MYFNGTGGIPDEARKDVSNGNNPSKEFDALKESVRPRGRRLPTTRYSFKAYNEYSNGSDGIASEARKYDEQKVGLTTLFNSQLNGGPEGACQARRGVQRGNVRAQHLAG